VSNSRTQKAYIDAQALQRGLKNIEVTTADLNDFQAPRQFDRVVSIECFEHMKNYQQLFKKVASWMNPGALFFCHVFCHRTMPYHFEVRPAY
jgi:cyclopropane-fatty-acyl-phospholipid synthase